MPLAHTPAIATTIAEIAPMVARVRVAKSTDRELDTAADATGVTTNATARRGDRARAAGPGHRAMKLIIVRHGDTEWIVHRKYTSSTDVSLTRHGRVQAESLAPLVERVLAGAGARVISSPRARATETAALALPGRPITLDPLIEEYFYGDFEGLTAPQIRTLAPNWDIWRDGCLHGESTEAVGLRADAFLDAHLGTDDEPTVVVTHGHFSRILAARALGLPPESGRLFASITASVSVIEDYHGERCIGRWNVDAQLLSGRTDRTATDPDQR